jgi:putative two-component system response regulator
MLKAHRLVMASEFKDEDTGDHIIRIGGYSSLISKKLNQSEQFIETMGFAAPMHDVGKIGIPDKILLKPGKLTKDEFAL